MSKSQLPPADQIPILSARDAAKEYFPEFHEWGESHLTAAKKLNSVIEFDSTQTELGAEQMTIGFSVEMIHFVPANQENAYIQDLARYSNAMLLLGVYLGQSGKAKLHESR